MTSVSFAHTALRVVSAAALSATLALFSATWQTASAASKAEELVETSRFSIEGLLADPEFFELKSFIQRARGVLIIPKLVKGGFIIGGEGGSGVLLVRGDDNSWSPPAFYTLAAGSIGLQIGGEVSEVVFTLMNQGAVNAILEDQFKLGVDASVAVGPFGAGLEASTTTNLDADIYAFSKSVGLFGGGAFEGAAILKRDSLNEEYYGAGATPKGITLERRFFNKHADRLRNALP